MLNFSRVGVMFYRAFMLLVLGVVPAFAWAQSEISPIKVYKFGYEIFESVSELTSEFNGLQSAAFDKCMLVHNVPNEAYACHKSLIISQLPGSQSWMPVINGEVSYIELKRDKLDYYIRSSGNFEEYSTEGLSLHAEIVYQCPANTRYRKTSDAMGYTVTCLIEREESCPLETENPISLVSGEKHLIEADYQSADGVLRFDRRFSSQSRGWSTGFGIGVKKPRTEILVEDNGPFRSCGYGEWFSFSHYPLNGDNLTDTVKVKRYVCASGSPLDSLVRVWLPYKFEYLAFVDMGGYFALEGGKAGKFTLSALNNSASNNEHWQLVDQNNDAYFYSHAGQIQRVRYASGIEVEYEYLDGVLVGKRDQWGRSLTFQYDAQDRLSAIQIPSGELVRYSYVSNEPGPEFEAIASVTWPDGKRKNYIYNEEEHVSGVKSDHMLLTGLTDSTGQRLFTYQYLHSKAVAEFGPNNFQKREIVFAETNTSLTDSYGSMRLYRFNELAPNGSRRFSGVSQPGGSGCGASASSITYYDNGDVKLRTDFTGNSKLYAYEPARRLQTVRVTGISGVVDEGLLAEGALLPASASKTTTQWHARWRLPAVVWQPQRKETYVYNGDADPFNNNAIASCSTAETRDPVNANLSVPLPKLCRKVIQQTGDKSGSVGAAASILQDANEQHWHYNYDAMGRFTELRLGDKLQALLTYYADTGDANDGQLESTTNALGYTQQWQDYTVDGRPQRLVDANGLVTALNYDDRGRLLTLTSITGTESFSYDLEGRLQTRQLATGGLLTYQYNASSLLESVRNSVNEQVHFEYDTEGNITQSSIRNAVNTALYAQVFTYDALGRMETLGGADGELSTFYYNPNGLLTQQTNPRNYEETYQYDGAEQLNQYQDQADGTVTFANNQQGKVLEVKDQRGLKTEYSYDAFGNLLQQTSPDTGTTLFEYDAAGNRTQRTDARGVVTLYSYDDLNRLTAVSYPSDSSQNQTFSYDQAGPSNYGMGKLTQIVDRSGITHFTYNAQGLVSSKVVTLSGVMYSTLYSYDAAGGVSDIVYPSGRSLHYSRNAYGQVTGISTKANANAALQVVVSDASYLPFGPLSSYTYGNGLVRTLTYDQRYQLVGNDVVGSGAALSQVYSRDPNGNINAIDDLLASAKSETYQYDALDRLTQASNDERMIRYGYDSVGNRLERIVNQGAEQTQESYSMASDSNRLLQVAASGSKNWLRDYSYDVTGNRVLESGSDGVIVESLYGVDNRYGQVDKNGQSLARYLYNALGQRVGKLAEETDDSERYHYSESGQLLAVTRVDGSPVREYLYLEGEVVAMLAAAPTNYAPVAKGDTFTILANQPTTLLASQLLGNDVDSNQDLLHISAVSVAQQGTVTLDINGDVVFTPAAGFSGVGGFTYQATDPGGLSASAQVILNIGNQPPVAINDNMGVSKNSATSIELTRLFSNDTDPDGDSVQLVSFTAPSVGALNQVGNTLMYTPAASAIGTASFSYTITDGKGGVASANVELLLVTLGTSGNDSINGTSGDDVIEGGAGDDDLKGGTGSDIYIWRAGDGNDTISNYDTSAGREDVLMLMGVTAGQVSYTRSGNHLWVSLSENTKITVSNFFIGEPNYHYALNRIQLDDGSFWTLADILALVQQGTAANDSLYGYAQNDVLSGGEGDDTIWGYAGTDTLQGDAGADKLYGGDDNDELNGGAGNDTVNGDKGDDLLYGGDGNDNLSGGDGDDQLDGGAGNDSLNGGSGSDTYLWRLGDGSDSISNSDTSAGREDLLKLVGVSVGQVSFTRSGNHLWVNLPNNTKITVSNFFIGEPNYNYALNRIQLDDGSFWTLADILVLVQQGTAANDNLYGYAQSDVLSGGEGDDTIWGYAGADTLQGDASADKLYGGDDNDELNGGAGNDTVNGDKGDDLLYGSDGNDNLSGGDGDDQLDGGAGIDSLNGGSGSDTYLWRLGDGSDSISNSDTSAGREDVLKLVGVTVEQVSFTRSGNHLWVNLPESAKITVSNFFLGAPTTYNYALNWIELDDGTKWNPSDLATLTAN